MFSSVKHLDTNANSCYTLQIRVQTDGKDLRRVVTGDMTCANYKLR